MFYLVAIAFYPALLALVLPIGSVLTASAGQREALEVETDSALSPIAGLAALIVAISLLLHFGAPSSVLVPIAVFVNILALVRLWRRRQISDLKKQVAVLLVGLVAYVILISPLLIAGRFGTLGYEVNNDPVFHSIMPEYLDAYGYDFPETADDGFTSAAIDKFVSQGYPDGWHQIVLLAMRLFRQRAFSLFNLTGAFFAALMVTVVYAWLRQVGVSLGWALVGGLMASIVHIQQSYLFQGFAPQVAVTPFIYACLFLFFKVLSEDKWRYVPLAALLLQASVAIYSFTIFLWVSVFILALVAYRLIATGRLTGLKIAMIAVPGIFILAAAINPFTLIGVGAALKMVAGWSAADSLGNLISRQVPILPVFGIWPTGDHRVVPLGWLHPATYVAATLIFVVFVRGVFARPSRPLLISAMTAMVIPAIILKLGASPYYFAKTLQLAGPFIVIGAISGFYFLSRKSGRRPAVLALLIIYVAGLMFSDQIAIRSFAITPSERFSELIKINDRFEDSKEMTLFIETGEDWAKYLLSNLKVVAPFALSYPGSVPKMRPVLTDREKQDIDTVKGVIGRKYGLVVIAKRQDVSLVPPPFELAFSGRFYNVYEKNPNGLMALDHRPFEIAPGSYKLAYQSLDPGKTVLIRVKKEFTSLLVSAYLYSKEDAGTGEESRTVVFSAGPRRVILRIGRLPSVYTVPLTGASGTVLRVKNNALKPLRLDWIEPLRASHDQAALFRYNYKNKRTRQSSIKL